MQGLENVQSSFRLFTYVTPQMSRALSVASATSQAFNLRHLTRRPWTESNFTIKDLSCNFGCRLLERSLIKCVIRLAHIYIA